jgi:hypothetical protein
VTCRQRTVQALHQIRGGERLAEETDCPGFEGAHSYALIREGCDEDERRRRTMRAYLHQQIDSGHQRHLHVGDHTRGVVRIGRPQKFFG